MIKGENVFADRSYRRRVIIVINILVEDNCEVDMGED